MNFMRVKDELNGFKTKEGEENAKGEFWLISIDKKF